MNNRKRQIVHIDGEKYLQTKMPASYNGSKETFRKDIHDNYIPMWQQGGIGFELTGKADKIQDDKYGYVLLVSVKQQ